jgi:CBS domain-containing protein
VRVKDLMTKDVITIGPEASLKDVASILAERGISGVPVVGEQGEVLGVVSEADILFKERGFEGRRQGFLGWLLSGGLEAEAKLTARTVREAMTSPAIAVESGRPVHEAAQKMTEYGVNRLPVLDDGMLVGIVTRADLVRAFTRSDAELLREICDEVIVHTLWISPDQVDVKIAKGEVTLSGRLETKTDAELLPRFVERVPGVVSVTSTLTWEYEDKPLPRGGARASI